MEIRLLRQGVDGTLEETPAALAPSFTDAEGKFVRLIVMPLFSPFTGCIELQVTPTEGSHLEPRMVPATCVNFVPENQVADTAVVNIILEHS